MNKKVEETENKSNSDDKSNQPSQKEEKFWQYDLKIKTLANEGCPV